MAKNGEHIWALLIGIEYKTSDPPLHSDVDVKNVRNWLLSKGTPADNIKILSNEEATRASILNVFESHLIQNQGIPQDGPILLYYSGHGARDTPPADWVAKGEATDGMIEFIVPYDALNADDSMHQKHAIPDRTIGALLRRLARAKGNNITVVFDCCNSAHATRGPQQQLNRRSPSPSAALSFIKRSIPAHRLLKLTADVDREIWNAPDAAPCEVEPRAPTHRGAVLRRQNETHMFLAACARDQEAFGDEEGGLFTRALVDALYKLGGRTETYDELHERTAACYNALHQAIPDAQRPKLQVPQFEGVHRARKLFASARGVQKWFTVIPHCEPGTVEIHVGKHALVRPGTRFRLIGPSPAPGVSDIDLGPARATDVKEFYCVATVDPAQEIGTEGVRAQIVSLGGERLRYAVCTSASPGDEGAASVRATLDARLADVPSTIADAVEYVEVMDAPDVILEACPTGIRIIHADPHLHSFGLPPPLVAAADVGTYFPAVLGALMRFHGALALGNPGAPHAGSVDVKLQHLPAPRPGKDIEDELRKAGRAYEFELPHHEAHVAPGKDVLYAVVLHSHAQVDFYPHVLLLDPATLNVEVFYMPYNANVPPLPSNKILQLGRPEECFEALEFNIVAGQSKETGVLKIVLATRVVDLASFRHLPVLGHDELGQPSLEKYLLDTQGGARGIVPSDSHPVDQNWDTLTRFFTVRPDVEIP